MVIHISNLSLDNSFPVAHDDIMEKELHWFLSYRIPEEQRFAIFGSDHFIYMIGGLLLIIGMSILVRKLNEKQAMIFIRSCALFLFAFYFVRAYLWYNYHWSSHILDFVPLHLCILSGFLLPVLVFMENKLLWNLTYSILLPGAVVAIITPENTLNFYHAYGWMPMVYYIWHILVIAIPVMQVASGKLRPDIRLFPKVILVLAGYAGLVYIFNKRMDTNFLYLNNAARGTPLEAFQDWLGNPGYLLPLVALVILICFLMFLPWYFLTPKTYVDTPSEKPPSD